MFSSRFTNLQILQNEFKKCYTYGKAQNFILGSSVVTSKKKIIFGRPKHI